MRAGRRKAWVEEGKREDNLIPIPCPFDACPTTSPLACFPPCHPTSCLPACLHFALLSSLIWAQGESQSHFWKQLFFCLALLPPLHLRISPTGQEQTGRRNLCAVEPGILHSYALQHKAGWQRNLHTADTAPAEEMLYEIKVIKNAVV